MLGNLLGGFIVILIGVNLIPPIANQIVWATNFTMGNVTGAAGTVLGLTVVFFALGIMAAGVSLAVVGMRDSGLI